MLSRYTVLRWESAEEYRALISALAAEHIAERRHFAELLREMKGLMDELDGSE